MSFIQIIDCHTDRLAEMQALDEEWVTATEGRRRLRRQIVARDRSDPNHYLVFVFFDSAEDARINSDLPETQHNAAKYAALLDAPPLFLDLDVVEDRTF